MLAYDVAPDVTTWIDSTNFSIDTTKKLIQNDVVEQQKQNQYWILFKLYVLKGCNRVK